jgi:N-acetylglucosamine malate deacetylase 1
MYEWLPYNSGILNQVPATDSERRVWLGETRKKAFTANPYREKLVELYGTAKGSEIRYCEAFQDSGYGTKLTKENIDYYFPFLKSVSR